MEKLIKQNRELLRTALFGILIAVACIVVQHSSQLVVFFFSEPITFQRNIGGLSTWSADISKLKEGTYFVSGGRPRGVCDLYVDQNKIASTRSGIKELRDGLLLGSTFQIERDNIQQTISIKCEKQAGFPGDLTHTAVILKRTPGIILQLWRGITELVVGPLASIIFFLGFIVLRPKRNTEPSKEYAFLFFGVCSFLYSVSLAYYPRLLIPGLIASIMHISIRNLFAVSGLLLFSTFHKRQVLNISIQIILTITALFIGLFSPNNLVYFYKIQYVYFPISSGLLCLELLKDSPKSRGMIFLRAIYFAWTVVLISELSVIWSGFGAYTAPSLIALLALSAIYVRYLENGRYQRIEETTTAVLNAINRKDPAKEMLYRISQITREQTAFSKVSAYVDGICFGVSGEKGNVFIPVDTEGNFHSTAQPLEVSNGDGKYMLQALEAKRPILQLGGDNTWFLVIPVGTFACINLSGIKSDTSYLAYESLQTIERIFPSLQTLEGKFSELSMQRMGAIQRIRSIRGEGHWEEELGIIFIDVNNYSVLGELHGDQFISFVSTNYFPALISALSQYAVPEHIIGDEILFVSIKDLLPEPMSVREAVTKALETTDGFVFGKGAELCTLAGFSPITLSMGINIATANLESDSTGVKISGTEVNHTKRLLDEAGVSGIVIKSSANLIVDSSKYRIGEPTTLLGKKNVISAQHIFRISPSFKKAA